MSETTYNLIQAMANGDAVETEQAFGTAMAEKLAVKLDDMRTGIAQNMFNQEVVTEEAEDETHSMLKAIAKKHRGMKHSYDAKNKVHVLHGHARGDEITNYIEVKHAGDGTHHYYHSSDGNYEVHKKNLGKEDLHKQISKAWKRGDVDDSTPSGKN